MISYLSGNCIYSDEKRLILDVNGVGYNIYTTPDILLTVTPESTHSLWIHMAVRENSMELFGFKTKAELDFFELIISISGIGPKSGLGIMSITTVESLTRAIATGDTSYLTKVSGIGKKTAERIVIELRDKMSSYSNDNNYSLRDEADALEALQSLGYTQRDARDALKEIDSEIIDTAARVKEALKILGNK